MKYIVLSFDDGRKDFFTNAFPILNKYNLTATLNVVTDYVGKNKITEFASGNYECISWENIIQCNKKGIEIACHSANHTNNIVQIIKGRNILISKLGGEPKDIGFASPNSEICRRNFPLYKKLIQSKKISYIRSGNQVRRDGYGYAILYILSKFTQNTFAYYLYNKRNIINISSICHIRNYFYPSVACNHENNSKQIISLIRSMPDDSAVILMFHSILNKDDPGWGRDKWFNSTKEFENICKYLARHSNIKVVTNRELNNMLSSNMEAE